MLTLNNKKAAHTDSLRTKALTSLSIAIIREGDNLAEAEDLPLFPEIDDDETVKQVKAFFTHKLPRFQRMSGWQLKDSLRSPVYDGMPKSHSNDNGAEQAILDKLERLDEDAGGYLANAGRIIMATIEAIKCCDVNSQAILIRTYSLRQSQTYIMEHTGYEESQYRVKKRDAHLQFADYFSRTRKECHAGYPDLIVYKNRRFTVETSSEDRRN